MLRLRFLMLWVLLLAAVGMAIWSYARFFVTEDAPETPVVAFATPAPQASLETLLLHEDNGSRQIVQCARGRCEIGEPPADLTEQAVFDGESWFYYREAVSEASQLVKRILQRTFVAGNTEQIIEDTPLTAARELLLSPNGKYLAFFLDNIDKPEAALTELWYYDTDKKGTRVLVEKLYRPDVLTAVRWNQSSTSLFFLADSGKRQDTEDKVELIAASVTLPGVAAKFRGIAWRELKAVVESGLIDIAPDNSRVAYMRPARFGGEELVIAPDAGAAEHLSLRGQVVYLHWLEDNSLIYAVQDQGGFTVWRWQDAVSRFLARRPGELVTAHSDPRGEYLVFVVTDAGESQLYSFHVASGSVHLEGELPARRGALHVVKVTITPPVTAGVAGTTSVLEDARLVAFIDRHIPEISGEPTVRLTRLVVTNEPNTVYVDYRTATGAEARLLLTVNEVAHADWSIKARYAARGAEWQKVQGGGLPDPAPVRLYEWEESVGKWILKSSNP